MQDVVLEWSVPYVMTPGKRVLKAILLAGMVVLCVDVILSPLLFLPFLAVLVIGVLLLRSWRYEYEFEYVNGDLLVSKIIRKEKRRDLYHCDRKDMEAVLKGRKKIQGRKIHDFTSGWEKGRVYTIQLAQDLIYLEPTDGFLEEMELHGLLIKAE